MKDQDFSDFLEDLSEGSYSEFPLTLTKDYFTLTPDQWKKFEHTVGKDSLIALNISESQISSMTPQMWGQIFAVAKAGYCKSLSISLDPTFKDLDRTQWNLFFEQMSQTAIKDFVLFQVDFHEMNHDLLKLFLERLSASHIEALQVYGLDFAYASREYCHLFFQGLSKCSKIKKFSIKNYAWLSTEGPFWEVFSEHLPALGMIELGLESIGINAMSESIWLALCDSLKQSSVTSLSLAGNKFHSFSPEKWNLVFEGLAKTNVVKLNIETFHPMQLSEEKWKAFKEGLESTLITTLCYRENQFTKEQKMDIDKILANNAEKDLSKSPEKQTSIQTVSDSGMEDVAEFQPLAFSYNLRDRTTKSKTLEHVPGKRAIGDTLPDLRNDDSQQKKRKMPTNLLSDDEHGQNIGVHTRSSKNKK